MCLSLSPPSSLSCLLSGCCLSGSVSCLSLLFAPARCRVQPLNLSPPNAAHVLPLKFWLVFRCGVSCGDAVGVAGGGECVLLLVPFQMLPLVASPWVSELGLDHQGSLVWFSFGASRFAFVSCSSGPFVLLGDLCRPGCLVFGGGLRQVSAPNSFRRVASGVYIYISLDHCLGYYSGMASAKGGPSGHSSDGCDDCCDDGELGVSISGLRHAGDEHIVHCQTEPHACSTPKFIYKNFFFKP